MKIKLLVSDLSNVKTDSLRPWGRLLINLVITGLGFLTAFSVFHFLSINGLQNSEPPKKDTVWVSLLNGNLYNPSAAITKPDSPKTATPLAQVPVLYGADAARIRKETIAKYNQVSPISETTKILSTHIYQSLQQSYPWWLLILLVILVLLGVLYVAYYNLPFLSLEMIRDADPQDLTAEFAAFRSSIEALGNPRKIKRFSNRIRFQYYCLNEQNLKGAIYIKALFQIVLFFEQQNYLISTSPDSPKPDIQDIKTFESFLKMKNIYSSSDQFTRLMYGLNRDSL